MNPAARISKRTCPRCSATFESDAAFCPNDGAALVREDGEPCDPVPDSDPYIGTVIHGDIEIKAVAGAGAMGRVYRAHQRGIDRDVAVKILHRELSGNGSLVQRFHREAKIASRLQHPHVVEVHLAGQLPDGALFIVMEYLDGESLAAATKASAGMMTLERALPIALQICDAVGEAHARGIVHRDLKPENVMLVHRADTADWVKVLDFGIAKVSLGEQSMETAAGLIFGTARYISPEGAQGSTVGPAGDVYSLAVILYQLLAGRTPFDAEAPVGLLIKHIHDEPPPLQSWAPAASVPDPIARVIMANLAKDPAERAPSARAFGNALAAAAREAAITIAEVGVVARMSLLELPPTSAGARTVERTIDDAAGARPPIPPPPTTSGERLRGYTGISSAGALPDTSADTAPLNAPLILTPAAPRAEPEREPESRPPSRRRTPVFVIALAFLLGVALTALVTQYVTHRADRERVAHIQRTRRALADGNYVEPPGENVRELVASGLQQWPDEPELTRIQSDAAHEMVTRAMAARSTGDVGGARDLARTAHDLDPTDGTARLLLSQYEDELAAVANDAGSALGGVRVTLEVPVGRLKPGMRADLVARVAGPSNRVMDTQWVIAGPGLSTDGITIAAPGVSPFKTTFTPPQAGTYEIQFEGNVDGTSIRAHRTLYVAR